MAEITPTCYEVIDGVDEAMRYHLDTGTTYFVLGGIATSALRHQDTQFDHVSQIIYAPEAAAEPTVRQENGTKRDIDVLVNKVLGDDEAQDIKKDLADALNDELVVSVFGFDEHIEYPTPKDKSPFSKKGWLSRRTVDTDMVLRYELYPLVQEVPDESYNPWTLVLPNDARVNVLHPAGHLLAYEMRSISGPRYKDMAKAAQMCARIEADPVFLEEINEGIFSSWNAFADAIQKGLRGELNPADPMMRPGTTARELAAFEWKGKALGYLEKQPALIKFAQTPIGEKILGGFVGTK